MGQYVRPDNYFVFFVTPSDHCKPFSSGMAIFFFQDGKVFIQAYSCLKVEVSDFFEVPKCNVPKLQVVSVFPCLFIIPFP